MSATTPGPNRRARRLAAKQRRGDKPMSRERLSKEAAIDKLRAQIQPEDYITSLEKMKQTYLSRAAELLGNKDLNAASDAIDERDVDMVNKQLDEALADLSWRVDAIEERIKDFADTKKDVTRPFERPEVASTLEEDVEDEAQETSALSEEEQVTVDASIARVRAHRAEAEGEARGAADDVDAEAEQQEAEHAVEQAQDAQVPDEEA